VNYQRESCPHIGSTGNQAPVHVYIPNRLFQGEANGKRPGRWGPEPGQGRPQRDQPDSSTTSPLTWFPNIVGATFESFACVEASPVHASSTGAKIVNPLDVTPSSAAAPLLDTASNAVVSLVRPWAERVVVGMVSAAERLTGKPMTWTGGWSVITYRKYRSDRSCRTLSSSQGTRGIGEQAIQDPRIQVLTDG
jgi:hypothetical protein